MENENKKTISFASDRETDEEHVMHKIVTTWKSR